MKSLDTKIMEPVKNVPIKPISQAKNSIGSSSPKESNINLTNKYEARLSHSQIPSSDKSEDNTLQLIPAEVQEVAVDQSLQCLSPCNNVQQESTQSKRKRTKSSGNEDDRAHKIVKKAPRYFTRSKRKRSDSTADDDNQIHKIARAMIAAYIYEENSDLTNETALSAIEDGIIKIPKSYFDAVNDSNHAQEWQKAIQEELRSLKENKTWKEVVRPAGANLVSMKWVFTVKRNIDGSVERFKARLVARGFSQAYGLDYDETFAPTAKMDTLRLFLSIVAKENLECWHFDIKNAFTESELKENIFFEPPPGVSVQPGKVLKALRSLYGLKQAAHDWHELIKAELIKWGFKQSRAEPCIFVNNTTGIILLVYVDDIAAAARSKTQLQKFFKILSARFKAKNLGEIEKILGARVTRDRTNRTLYIDQEQYLSAVLDKFGITTGKHKAKKIPVADYESLRPATAEDERIDLAEYQQAIGSLLYAMIFSRPDIAFVVGKLSQFMSDPAKHHGHALKNLLRYLRSTMNQKLRFGPGGAREYLTIYSDADWANDKSDRKSISGSVAMFYGGPISWSSKKQRAVSTSSCESEYVALSACAKHGQWLAQLLRDIGREN